MDAKPVDAPIELSPYCRLLRSKRIFFLAGPPRTESDVLDASNSCWCARTMRALGPDRDVVHPDECRAGRSCYEPWVAPPSA
jgi:hypothetical protein